ncbi:MAG: hypothetical protein HBSAPP03_18170 [Phycisphaerae bacterium]|nr:MAG: hypothetical protein HBSAPP03_18170 [Phycisphaerae bacterium]
MSLPEVLLWQRLRREQLLGLRFRRQHVLGPFIADFFCHEVRLVVEVDGRVHESRGEDDRRRDAWMLEQGLTVVRLEAGLVLSDIVEALECIARMAVALKPSIAQRSMPRR